MELSIDPNATLAELQLTLFMAAITALVELAKTTDKDHIKLRALTEVARLCNPAVRTPLPRGLASGRGGERATGFAPSPTSSMPSSSASSSASPPHGTRSASDGPQASTSSHADGQPHAPAPVARAPGSVKRETPLPRATGIGSAKPVSPAPTEDLPLESLLPLNRRQRRFLARLEANERKRATPCAA